MTWEEYDMVEFYKKVDKNIVMSYLENAAKECIVVFEKLLPYFTE